MRFLFTMQARSTAKEPSKNDITSNLTNIRKKSCNNMKMFAYELY